MTLRLLYGLISANMTWNEICRQWFWLTIEKSNCAKLVCSCRDYVCLGGFPPYISRTRNLRSFVSAHKDMKWLSGFSKWLMSLIMLQAIVGGAYWRWPLTCVIDGAVQIITGFVWHILPAVLENGVLSQAHSPTHLPRAWVNASFQKASNLMNDACSERKKYNDTENIWFSFLQACVSYWIMNGRALIFLYAPALPLPLCLRAGLCASAVPKLLQLPTIFKEIASGELRVLLSGACLI